MAVTLTDDQLVVLTDEQRGLVPGNLTDAQLRWLGELCDRLKSLKRTLFNGSLLVRFENGVEVRYNSNQEISNAIAAIEADIARLLGTVAPRRIMTSLRSGIRA